MLGNQFNTKYVEVISLQLICAMINSIPSLIAIPIVLFFQKVTIFVFVTWLLHYPLLFLWVLFLGRYKILKVYLFRVFLPEGEFRAHLKFSYMESLLQSTVGIHLILILIISIKFKTIIFSSCSDSSILRLWSIQQQIYKQLWLASLLTRLVRLHCISNQP